jgi:hypothetical protein
VRETYLKALLDLFDKHIAICCKAVYCEHGAIGAVLETDECEERAYRRCGHEQTEDLWGIAGLDVVAFALAGVARDDGEICAGDGEDGAAVVGVRVELVLEGRGALLLRLLGRVEAGSAGHGVWDAND